jgi:predicted ABC-type sugar transport system permease subunit
MTPRTEPDSRTLPVAALLGVLVGLFQVLLALAGSSPHLVFHGLFGLLLAAGSLAELVKTRGETSR